MDIDSIIGEYINLVKSFSSRAHIRICQNAPTPLRVIITVTHLLVVIKLMEWPVQKRVGVLVKHMHLLQLFQNFYA